MLLISADEPRVVVVGRWTVYKDINNLQASKIKKVSSFLLFLSIDCFFVNNHSVFGVSFVIRKILLISFQSYIVL